MHFDALVVGGGIGGLEAALDLAEQGYGVAVVEKDASIGGKMIRLSKVFPTLDCSSCITTPKMAAAAHHQNITLFTYSSIELLAGGRDGRLTAQILRKPRFVDEAKCIGCRQCEYVCPVYAKDLEQGGLSARKAIGVPFSNAIPQTALLDVDNCMLCGQCAKVCPTGAVDYFQQPVEIEIRADAVILATGYEVTPIENKQQYGEGKIPNVVTALQMERLLAPHGPYNRVLRPSDGMEPDSVGFVQCAGSRDRSMGIPYCSRVCCMYAIKQAMLLSGALPLADIFIYYMDIRAFGKGYEQFYQTASAMGIQFVRAKVGSVGEGGNGGVKIRYEQQDSGGGVTMAEHDLVVLSLGLVPGWSGNGASSVAMDRDGFIYSPRPKIAPALTSMEGVFACGAALGPKDIVDTIAEAGAAAMEASRYLAARRRPGGAAS